MHYTCTWKSSSLFLRLYTRHVLFSSTTANLLRLQKKITYSNSLIQTSDIKHNNLPQATTCYNINGFLAGKLFQLHRAFSGDVTAAVLVFRNNWKKRRPCWCTKPILLCKIIFCLSKPTWWLVMWVKTLYKLRVTSKTRTQRLKG